MNFQPHACNIINHNRAFLSRYGLLKSPKCQFTTGSRHPMLRSQPGRRWPLSPGVIWRGRFKLRPCPLCVRPSQTRPCWAPTHGDQLTEFVSSHIHCRAAGIRPILRMLRHQGIADSILVKRWCNPAFQRRDPPFYNVNGINVYSIWALFMAGVRGILPEALYSARLGRAFYGS